MNNVNCKSFKEGKCIHQAAPRYLFGAADCILVKPIVFDVRVPRGCALQTPWPKPTPPKETIENDMYGDIFMKRDEPTPE